MHKHCEKIKNIFSNIDICVALWIAGFAIAMIPNLNNAYPYQGDESYYTVSAMNMIQRGEYLEPWYFGTYRFNKPILPYLFVKSAYRLFGISMWSARLMTLLITCIILFVTYRSGVLLFEDKKRAFLATTILSSCYLCISFARIAMTEPILVFFSLCSLYSYSSMFKLKNGLLARGMSGAIFTGLAFMTKGPVGLFPLLTALFYACIVEKNEWRKFLRAIINPFTIGIILIIIAPWYIYIKLTHSAILEQNLHSESRAFFTSMSLYKIIIRLFFYSGVLLLVHIPFTITALFHLRRNRETNDSIRYLWWYCSLYLFIFIFFVDVPRERYLTAIIPAVSLICAFYLFSIQWIRWIKIAAFVTCIQICIINCYPLFSHEELRALVHTWKTKYSGSLGLPIDVRSAGWCRLFAHDTNIVPVEKAEFLIVADNELQLYNKWNLVSSERRLTSIKFRHGKPECRYRIFHLLKRPEKQ